MMKLDRGGWFNIRAIAPYAVALASVAAALAGSRWLDIHAVTAPVSLLLCAVMFCAWFGGFGPGVLASILSILAFKYYYAAPLHSLAADVKEIPRIFVFALSALFAGLLSAAQRSSAQSFRRARDDLAGSVQALEQSNTALRTENAERIRAEEALRNAQADLTRVARLTTMGELAASIAHEVNQPLMAVVTNADTCLRWLAKDPPDLDEAREAAKRTVGAGHRASDIIRTIRTLARKSTTEATRFDVNSAISDVLALTSGELQRNDVLLETELSAGLEPVSGDRGQIQQVVLNLTVNAIEAMTAEKSFSASIAGKLSHGRAAERSRRSGGYRDGARSDHGRRHFRCLLHNQARRNRDGAVNLPLDRRSPWRPIVGIAEFASGQHLQVYSAAGGPARP